MSGKLRVRGWRVLAGSGVACGGRAEGVVGHRTGATVFKELGKFCKLLSGVLIEVL